MPQLQINQGPQDALLYDNQRSYFTNVGYVRTSNFQVEYRSVDAQNSPAWGSTMQYIIPKAADLLGPVDLRVKINDASLAASGMGGSAAGSTRMWTQWVDELGFAMLEKITFSVGSNDIETLTGEQLQIRNELMTSDEMRLGHGTILKTGSAGIPSTTASLGKGSLPGTADVAVGSFGGGPKEKGKGFGVNKDFTRLVEARDGTAAYTAGTRELIIPLGLFFTKHVSQYFPLAAVAGCNDIRISIKLRPLNELLQASGLLGNGQSITLPTIAAPDAKLFCHYVHVTGPEAQQLMNKEHVRLLKLFQHQPETISTISGNKIDMNLSFLHPVSTLLVTIRAADDLTSEKSAVTASAAKTIGYTPGVGTSGSEVDGKVVQAEMNMAGKGHFFYHGDGTNPNYDRKYLDAVIDGDSNNAAASVAANSASTFRPSNQGTVKVKSIALTLNGQERHPGLDKGLDVDYIRERLMPMLHSNSNQVNKAKYALAGATGISEKDYGMQGSKNIFVYPFSLNPEGSNPSGAVNFSKVSHAKLTLHLDDATVGPLALTSDGKPSGMPLGLRVDVYALYYNWLQIKDGRALLSFA